MPHNRDKRESQVKAKYEFYVHGGEYGIFNALLGAADVLITGGTYTYQFLKDEVQQFGIDLATAMAAAGLNPLTEALYFDKFIFETWETPVPGLKLSTGNKFVPYVGARKKTNAGEMPISRPMDQRISITEAGPSVIYMSRINGKLFWYKHEGQPSGVDQWANNGQGKAVGTGWNQFVGLLSGSNGVLYGIRTDGELMWYKHLGTSTSADQWENAGQGKQIGSGFQSFTQVLGGESGVIYAVKPTGEILWYKHNGHATGADQWANNGQGKQIGTGWNQFASIVSGGNGVLYAIKPGGELVYYKHLGFGDGTNTFAHNGQGKQIGTGWQQFTGVFSGGGGILYAIKPTGELLWFKHEGHADGSAQWANNGQGKQVGKGWVLS